MNINPRLLLIPAMIGALVMGSAAACPAAEGGADGGYEVEDCDAEDRRNREPECGFVGGRPKATTTKAKGSSKTTGSNRSKTTGRSNRR